MPPAFTSFDQLSILVPQKQWATLGARGRRHEAKVAAAPRFVAGTQGQAEMVHTTWFQCKRTLEPNSNTALRGNYRRFRTNELSMEECG